jgi:hypothetical protein
MQQMAVRTANSMLSGLMNAFGCTTCRQVLVCRWQQMAEKTSPTRPSGFKKTIFVH